MACATAGNTFFLKSDISEIVDPQHSLLRLILVNEYLTCGKSTTLTLQNGHVKAQSHRYFCDFEKLIDWS
jgi:hypothetical protein